MEKNHPTTPIVSLTAIEQRIHQIRDKRVMLDSDLAILYEVKTEALNRAYKRNLDRFPEDFAFQLTQQEFANLKSQSVTQVQSTAVEEQHPMPLPNMALPCLRVS